ncbi:MAG: exodeoxyribonuclease VII small subunit, partial [Rhodocyclaceae bacterium]|nr:exodeoxyribonuclease VII small subunit [Rhodocyclaceae bacterium]
TLEGGGAPLEESLKAYERGTGLLNFCQATLSQAEQKIRILDNNGTIRDFGDVGDLGEIPPPNSAGESS